MSRRKKQKSPSFWGVFFIILTILAALCVYSYRTNEDFKARADSLIAQLSEARPPIGKIGESDGSAESAESREAATQGDNAAPSETPKQTASHEQSAKSQESSIYKLVSLPERLEIPLCAASRHEADHEIRAFAHYALCYRESYEQAEWSAYCLTSEELAKNAARSNDFRPDPEISTGSASLADYRKSSYDRGHLSPAADFAFDEQAMSETFFMSNMSPQAGGFNRGIWKDLEAQVRVWARLFGRVYVVSGPILEKPAAEYKAIGENRVAVPEFYYKVLLAPLYADEADRATPEDAGGAIAIGFIFPNEKCGGTIFDYAVSVDEVEVRTSLDFFSLLDDSIENEIEQNATQSLERLIQK